MNEKTTTGSEVINQSVQRACHILSLFNAYRNKWTMKEIAEACGVTPTTVLPILRSLEAAGYLERDQKTKQYRLGLLFVEKGNIVVSGLDLREQAADIIRGLSNRFKVNSHLGILDGCEVIYIDRYAAVMHTLSASFIGRRVPVYCTAMGKAMLANLESNEIYQTVEKIKFIQYTNNTITDRVSLMQELNKVKKQGYSVDDAEFQMGGFCIGAPVFDSTNTVAGAISASVTNTPENMSRINELIMATVNAAKTISQRMGYRRS